MPVVPPNWMIPAGRYLRANWPTTNEDILRDWAREFAALGRLADETSGNLQDALDHVHANNDGPAVAAFLETLRSPDSSVNSLARFKRSCDEAAQNCEACADIVRLLKLGVTAQLGVMAVALASGRTALATRAGVNEAIDSVIEEVAARVARMAS